MRLGEGEAGIRRGQPEFPREASLWNLGHGRQPRGAGNPRHIGAPQQTGEASASTRGSAPREHLLTPPDGRRRKRSWLFWRSRSRSDARPSWPPTEIERWPGLASGRAARWSARSGFLPPTSPQCHAKSHRFLMRRPHAPLQLARDRRRLCLLACERFECADIVLRPRARFCCLLCHLMFVLCSGNCRRISSIS